MSRKINLLTTFGIGFVCAVLLLFVGVFAVTRSMPAWFSVYVSANVDARVEIAVDNGAFTPIFDNVMSSEDFPLYDEGMYLDGDKIVLPLENLTSTSQIHLKIFNYSTEKALNAEVKNGGSTYGIEVYSGKINNLKPAGLGATLESYTIPYDYLTFSVNALFKDTAVTLELNLELTEPEVILDGAYTVGTYATGTGPRSSNSADNRYKYYMQMGEYPQTIVSRNGGNDSTYLTQTNLVNLLDSAMKGIEADSAPKYSIGQSFTIENTNNLSLDLNGDKISDYSGDLHLTLTKSYSQGIAGSARQIYWFETMVDGKSYKFVNSAQYAFSEGNTSYKGHYSDGTWAPMANNNGANINGTTNNRGWFYVQPITYIVLGEEEPDGATTNLKGYDAKFLYNEEVGFFNDVDSNGGYNTGDTLIPKVLLNTELVLDVNVFDTGNENLNGTSAYTNNFDAVPAENNAGVALTESKLKTFLNNDAYDANNFATLSGLSNMFTNTTKGITSTATHTRWLNTYTDQSETYPSDPINYVNNDGSSFIFPLAYNSSTNADGDAENYQKNTYFSNGLASYSASSDYATAHYVVKINKDNSSYSSRIITNNFTPISTYGGGTVNYWLRSGYPSYSNISYRVNSNGNVSYGSVYNTYNGVRPSFIFTNS